jgi:hypothetical protein
MADLRELHEQWAAAERSLLQLRPLFAMNEAQSCYRDWFDELLEHREFEVALHRLVDFLLEPSTPGIGPFEVEQIGNLHRSMELTDNCCLALNKKSRSSDAATHGDIKHPYL